MTIAEVAKLIDKSEQSVRRSIKSGKLKATMVDGRYEIEREDIPDSLRDSQAIVTDSQAGSQTDSQAIVTIENLEKEIGQLRLELDEAEKKAVLVDELISDKKNLQEQIAGLQEQLRESSHRHDTVVMQMSRLVQHYQLPFWRRWFQRKALPSPDEEDRGYEKRDDGATL